MTRKKAPAKPPVTKPAAVKSGRSRETKTSGLLTRAIVDRVAGLIEKHGFVAHVAAELGVHRQRFDEWAKRGERETSGIYRDFALAVARGRAAAESKRLAVVGTGMLASGVPDWKAAAWQLEKMNPSAFGPRSTTVNVAPLERFMKLLDAEPDHAEHAGCVGRERLYELGIEALSEEA